MDIKEIPRRANILEKRFGTLLIRQLVGERLVKLRTQTRHHYVWEAVCDCGTVIIDIAKNLTRRKSCGCHIVARSKAYISERALKEFFCRYRSSARQRKIQFALTYVDFCQLIQSNCHYCGDEPVWRGIGAKSFDLPVGVKCHGIDRMNSLLPYTLENCVPCCSACNYCKQEVPYEEFKDRIRRMYINWAVN